MAAFGFSIVNVRDNHKHDKHKLAQISSALHHVHSSTNKTTITDKHIDPILTNSDPLAYMYQSNHPQCPSIPSTLR